MNDGSSLSSFSFKVGKKYEMNAFFHLFWHLSQIQNDEWLITLNCLIKMHSGWVQAQWSNFNRKGCFIVGILIHYTKAIFLILYWVNYHFLISIRYSLLPNKRGPMFILSRFCPTSTWKIPPPQILFSTNKAIRGKESPPLLL